MSSYNRIVTRYENGITEVIDYEKTIDVGYKRQVEEVAKVRSNGRVKLGRVKGKKSGFKEENIFKNSVRAKKKIRSLCNNNAYILTKFITLTFADVFKEHDLLQANSIYSKFIKKLSYAVNQKIEYLTVPELTKEGNIHYHMLCNLPYVDIEKIQEIWGYGICYINKIEDILNVSAYISSYVDKDFGKTFAGSRHFLKSKGIVYPESLKIQREEDSNIYSIDNLVYKSFNNNFYCGDVVTKIYDKNSEWS